MKKTNTIFKIKIILAILIFCFFIAGFLITAVKTHNRAERAQIEAAELVSRFESFRAVEFNISRENLERALQNSQVVEVNVRKLWGDVDSLSRMPAIDADMTPFRSKQYVQQRCRSMAGTLHNYSVEVGSLATGFSFQPWLIGGGLPAPDDVPALIWSLSVVEDIVLTAAEAEVSHIHGLERSEFKTLAAASGSCMSVALQMSGDLDSIRRFVNGLTQSSNLYHIHSLELRSGLRELPAPPSELRGATKDKRLLQEQTSRVRADVIVDFIALSPPDECVASRR